MYFFVAIALGLGMGANQRLVTLVGAIIIILYIVIQNMNTVRNVVQQNLIVTISNTSKTGLDENKILEILNKYSSKIDLRRLDAVNNSTEISLNIEFNDFESIIKAKNDLKTIGDIQFSFIENY